MICAIHCIGTATVTLTSTLDGRQAACPGEVVTYTFTALRTTVVSWFAFANIDGVDYLPRLESNWAAGFGDFQLAPTNRLVPPTPDTFHLGCIFF